MKKQNNPITMPTETRDFRLYLQHELIRRCECNPNYSLRAFAKAIGTNHASLSTILSGKRPLTIKAIIKLAHGIGTPSSKVSDFVAHLKGDESGALANLDHRELTIDTFISISEWYHDAIMELINIKNFNGDSKWITKVLGISVSEVNIAVERLQRLDLLKISEDGKWLDQSRNNPTNISNDLSSSALRKLQKNILELSIKALEDLPRAQRDHTSIVFAMQSSDLEQIKEKIKRFRYELAAFVERDGVRPDAVFQFAASVFPLTRGENK